ncbi:hypothetical protein KC19_2G018100 [Ceratodon purpureus]|uniref:Uncharacterized protein n=1 Tax=Ceratodon purpureus TaxID=3225 RepID=A0A8T0IR36_CERPU|nr:hypothetical protein KC19_2G018100 [Ceratodon purpureus]
MAGMSGSRPDAVLGTREFSRVRQFDMEERRKRILGNPKYKIAVDKEALDKQVKSEIEYRLKQEKAKEQFEQWELTKIAAMKKTEELLEKERRINNMEYEQYWQEQQKCKVQREVDEKMHLLSVNERIGPFDKIRYDDQDMEPQKSSAIQMSVNHVRLWQEQLAMQKKEQESKARIDWIQKDIENRKRLRQMEANIKAQIFDRDKKIEREMLNRSQEKFKEAQMEHLENHMYQIAPEYFEQFQTTAR